MPVLDASALTTDPEGLEFLRDVLGTETASPARPFPRDAWTAKTSSGFSIDSAITPATAPAMDTIEPRFAEPAL